MKRSNAGEYQEEEGFHAVDSRSALLEDLTNALEIRAFQRLTRLDQCGIEELKKVMICSGKMTTGMLYCLLSPTARKEKLTTGMLYCLLSPTARKEKLASLAGKKDLLDQYGSLECNGLSHYQFSHEVAGRERDGILEKTQAGKQLRAVFKS